MNRVFRSESEMVWLFSGIYIINGILHSRLTVRNFSSRVKKLFQGEISCLRTAIHPKISIHIVHTALYSFPKVLIRKICLPVKRFFRW